MLTDALEVANQHVSLLSLAYLGEEVTYGVMVMRTLLLEEFTRADPVIRAAYISCRCVGLAYVFIRLNRSVIIPRSICELIASIIQVSPGHLKI